MVPRLRTLNASWARAATTKPWSYCPARAALPLVVGLFAVVTALRWFLDGSGQAAALLYVVPIALCALWFGRHGGLGSATGGAVLFVVLGLVHGHGDLDATGWADPVLAMSLVGGLIGELSERVARERGFATRHAMWGQRLEELCERQQSALVASDSLAQTLAAARWMLEAGATNQAIDVLNSGVTAGIEDLATSPRTAEPQRRGGLRS